jgi:hypothetical protein
VKSGLPEFLVPLDRFLWEAALDHAPSVSLAEALTHAYPEGSPDQVTVWTMCTDGVDPAEELSRRAGEKVGVILERLGATSLLYVPDGEGAYVAAVWPTSYPDTYFLVGTAPVTSSRWRRLERWVLRSAPRLFVPYLTETEFEAVLNGLGNIGETAVSRLTARALEQEESSYSRGWRAQRHRRSHVEVLAEIRGFYAPKTIALEVVGHLSLHLRRNAGATYYGGDFDIFERVVMHRFAQTASERRQLFLDRERESSLASARPLRIRLATDAFGEPDALASLIESLSQRGTSVAVLHGNPYIHIALTNYADGSNVDAFVFHDNELVMYPGYTASTGALARIAADVSERFEATDVSNAPDLPPPTREELLTTG